MTVADPEAFVHAPVLLDEVVELFTSCRDGVIVDATLGGGGHAAALVDGAPDRSIIGIDRDRDALAAAASRPELRDRLTTLHARFDDGLRTLLATRGADEPPVVGVLFDLGVSSPQFDRGERGFSYRIDAPLDMRMDRSAGRSAADLVNDAPEAELARILRTFGDERFAARIARAIVASRPIDSTVALAEVVRNAIPAAARRRGGHPAKRTFQALRIAVNDELEALEGALEAALDLVASGGRVAAISYHSGEDRRVKAAFRDAVDGGCTCPPNLPCACGAVVRARNLTRGGVTPGAAEIERNPRAASARLRAVELL